jgi:hypothetical protein
VAIEAVQICKSEQKGVPVFGKKSKPKDVNFEPNFESSNGPILSRPLEERRKIADDRLSKISQSVSFLGCSVLAARSPDAINFYAKQQFVTAVVDLDDPSRISLKSVFGVPENNLNRVVMACHNASRKAFVAKATATDTSDGVVVELNVSLFSEEVSAILFALPAYLNDLMDLYDAFLDEVSKVAEQ